MWRRCWREGGGARVGYGNAIELESAYPDLTLEDAVDIQQRCYRLLRWLQSRVDDRELPLAVAHSVLDEVETTECWLVAHWPQLPPDARPPSVRDSNPLRGFANYFTSYVMVSFELVRHPPTHLSSSSLCFCPICARLRLASHLRPRRITSAIKRYATEETVEHVLALAHEDGVAPSRDEVRRWVLTDLRADAALSTYGVDLLARVRGRTAHPMSLALWRRFAWTPSGAPRQGFRLTADGILAAEQRVRARLVRSAQAKG